MQRIRRGKIKVKVTINFCGGQQEEMLGDTLQRKEVGRRDLNHNTISLTHVMTVSSSHISKDPFLGL